MHLNSDLDCCGLREISGLSDADSAEHAMLNLYTEYIKDEDDTNWRHAIFTEAGRTASYGKKFAAYITEHKLGTVTSTPRSVNPNSGNPLKAYIWTVNWDGLKKWTKKKADTLDEFEAANSRRSFW